MPSAVLRWVDGRCGRTIMIPLGELEPIECLCGQDYDPKTGTPLPICEGFELPEPGQDPLTFDFKVGRRPGSS